VKNDPTVDIHITEQPTVTPSLVYPHPDIPEPKDHESIWRYLNFTKFVAMLQKRSLYFRRADKFSDRWEGVIPTWLINWCEKHAKLPASAGGATFAEYFRKVEIGRQYLNCWHRSDTESAAMWSIYGKSEEAVSIRSTVGGFKQSLAKARVQEANMQVDIMIGNVDYADHQSWQPQVTSSLDVFAIPFFVKRRSFSYEQEFRAKVDGADVFANDPNKPFGINVDVDLQALIEKIYVAPGANQSFKELVTSVLKQYGFSNIVVEHSPMDAAPLM
jgi:hypothetical protein